MRSPRLSFSPPRAPAARWLLVALHGGLLRPGCAETTLAYKYQDYREAGGRIAVHAHYALLEQSLADEARLKLTGVVDTIAGAPPTGEPPAIAGGAVPLPPLRERREAWTAEYARPWRATTLAFSVARSRESDYLSTGLALNTRTDFNRKNTTLNLGLAGTRDDIRVFHRTPWEHKRTHDLLAGVTHLLGPDTQVTLNLGYGRATGYLSDPYKIIRQTTELLPGLSLPLTFPENRPWQRTKRTAFLGLNHAVGRLRGALEAGYRLHDDSFGITSHAFEAGWFQKLGRQLVLAPTGRHYRQSAAAFYHPTLDGLPVVPTNQPTRAGPFYSADYRLAALATWTYGLKLVWLPGPALQLDLAWENYRMRSRDRATSANAFPRASTVTAGLRFNW